MLFKHDADALKRTIRQGNQTLRVEMSFPSSSSGMAAAAVTTTAMAEQPSIPKVTLDFWMTPTDSLARVFVTQFHSVMQAFSTHMEFQLHMYLINGTRHMGCGVQQQHVQQHGRPCQLFCTNYGRYCAMGDDLSHQSGAEIVQEELRQLCIWSQPSPNKDGYPGDLWWNYVTEYYRTCFSKRDEQGKEHGKSHRLGSDTATTSPLMHRNHDMEACVDHIFEKVPGLDRHVIDQCIVDSGGVRNNRPNNKLEHELHLQSQHTIYTLPTLYVDQVPFAQGRLMAASTVFQSLCQSHWRYNLPPTTREYQLCTQCDPTICPDFVTCLTQNGQCPAFRPGASTLSSFGNSRGGDANVTGGISVSTLVSSMLSLVVVMVVVVVWHWHWARSERLEDIREIVADYYILLPPNNDDAHDQDKNNHHDDDKSEDDYGETDPQQDES